MEFMRKYQEAGELNDLANKIMRAFNLVFLAGAQKSTKEKVADVTLHEYRELRMYLKNIAKFFSVNSLYATIKMHQSHHELGSQQDQ